MAVRTILRCSMYGIFTYIWVIFRVNVGKYSSTMEHMGYLDGVIKVLKPNLQLGGPTL